jgi:hypothetical protein
MRSSRQNKVTIMTVNDMLRYSEYVEEKKCFELSPPREEPRVPQMNFEILWKSGTKKQLENGF